MVDPVHRHGHTRVELTAVQFVGGNQVGDYLWMLTQPEYANTLFVFNDNEQEFRTHRGHVRSGETGLCRPGGGNAIIRPAQCTAEPRAAGIPTGASGAGYPTLDARTRDVIDEAFGAIFDLLASGRFTRVVYSAEPDGRLGVGIFQPGADVIDHITDQLRALATARR